ncbi:MAG TPA: hypothetical protein VFO00_03350 [Vitreimonas sp.]|nr:hypothetical protein [Vitreimonas sp.]
MKWLAFSQRMRARFAQDGYCSLKILFTNNDAETTNGPEVSRIDCEERARLQKHRYPGGVEHTEGEQRLHAIIVMRH